MSIKPCTYCEQLYSGWATDPRENIGELSICFVNENILAHNARTLARDEHDGDKELNRIEQIERVD